MWDRSLSSFRRILGSRTGDNKINAGRNRKFFLEISTFSRTLVFLFFFFSQKSHNKKLKRSRYFPNQSETIFFLVKIHPFCLPFLNVTSLSPFLSVFQFCSFERMIQINRFGKKLYGIIYSFNLICPKIHFQISLYKKICIPSKNSFIIFVE